MGIPKSSDAGLCSLASGGLGALFLVLVGLLGGVSLLGAGLLGGGSLLGGGFLGVITLGSTGSIALCALLGRGVAYAARCHAFLGFCQGNALHVLALCQCCAALLLVVLAATAGYIDL